MAVSHCDFFFQQQKWWIYCLWLFFFFPFTSCAETHEVQLILNYKLWLMRLLSQPWASNVYYTSIRFDFSFSLRQGRKCPSCLRRLCEQRTWYCSDFYPDGQECIKLPNIKLENSKTFILPGLKVFIGQTKYLLSNYNVGQQIMCHQDVQRKCCGSLWKKRPGRIGRIWQCKGRGEKAFCTQDADRAKLQRQEIKGHGWGCEWNEESRLVEGQTGKAP